MGFCQILTEDIFDILMEKLRWYCSGKPPPKKKTKKINKCNAASQLQGFIYVIKV